MRTALDATRVTDSFSNDTYNSGAKAAALSIFESTKQRFFGQILIGMKLPSLIPAINADLARRESVVIQLVSTSEAMLNRALAALNAEDRANLDIELSPKEFVMSYLTAAFPVRQMKTFVDDTGKTLARDRSADKLRSQIASPASPHSENHASDDDDVDLPSGPLKSFDFGELPLAYNAKECPFCKSHIMGDRAGRNCSTTYQCGPSPFLTKLQTILDLIV